MEPRPRYDPGEGRRPPDVGEASWAGPLQRTLHPRADRGEDADRDQGDVEEDGRGGGHEDAPRRPRTPERVTSRKVVP